MESAKELFESCRLGKLPRLSVMVDFGLDGRDGVNPVDLFRAYRKHTTDDLYTALVHDKLSELTGVPGVSSGLLSNNS
jgi:hypothetical protein